VIFRPLLHSFISNPAGENHMTRYWFILSFIATVTVADMHYVDINNLSPSSPYTNWTSAANSIEDAVSASTDGDLVLVAPGTYYPPAPDGIVVNKAIAIQSKNGPATTIIDGQNYKRGFNVDHEQAVISGFTIKRGYGTYYDIYEHMWKPGSGGGVICPPHSDSIVSNCVIRECNSTGGGGMFGGTAINSRFIGNISTYNGGGMAMGVAKGCIFQYNHAKYDGGGVSDGVIRNCAIIENTCEGDGGGVRGHEVYNSIVYYNVKTTDNSSNNIQAFKAEYNCCPELPHGTDGNITNNPMFISQATGNFRQKETSPCVDAGLSAYAVSIPEDLDGNRRIRGIRVDMGAYEYQPLEFEGSIYLRASLEQSFDLQSWTNSGYSMEWTVPHDASNQFFRTKLEILD
jgi:hypothetical protein